MQSQTLVARSNNDRTHKECTEGTVHTCRARIRRIRTASDT